MMKNTHPADDLGWNDVSWHNPDIYMPNLQKMATENAVILNQSYVAQLCSPTRSALLTGYYPYHIGTQNGVFNGLDPSGVPTSFSFLPEDLKELGYSTYMVGKWHLGFCKTDYLPTNRGFDKYFGYYTGMEDYFTHWSDDHRVDGVTGLDFWKHRGGRNNEPLWQYNGSYSSEIFSQQAQEVLDDHNKTKPFFLYLAFQSVHSPLEVPNEYRKDCKQHRDQRNIYCGMVKAMDTAVEEIISKLKSLGLYDNTIVIFSNDNGGETRSSGGGNNWPLRGNKNTLWEGGCRAVSFIHSPRYLKDTARVSESLFHIADWYATILQMANDTANNNEIPILNHGDGLGQWEMIKRGNNTNPRDTVVLNINSYEIAFGIRQGRYKYVKGYPGSISDWVPPTRSGVEHAIFGEWLFDLIEIGHAEIRKTFAEIIDPTEHHNLNASQPQTLAKMRRLLKELQQTEVPTVHKPFDMAGDPKNFNNTWMSGWCQ